MLPFTFYSDGFYSKSAQAKTSNVTTTKKKKIGKKSKDQKSMFILQWRNVKLKNIIRILRRV